MHQQAPLVPRLVLPAIGELLLIPLLLKLLVLQIPHAPQLAPLVPLLILPSIGGLLLILLLLILLLLELLLLPPILHAHAEP